MASISVYGTASAGSTIRAFNLNINFTIIIFFESSQAVGTMIDLILVFLLLCTRLLG